MSDLSRALQRAEETVRQAAEPKIVAKFRCVCGSWTSRVKDARPTAEGYTRKRECLNPACKRTFLTVEKVA